ncbi:MAG TPA: DMT family transporter [Candidatus Kapabacteria bacterium]|nr:DMT family transporter [Candidatus Kapabacteria bacterium]HPO61691.1 DMT family transporter [Candidatus Kapabacteria bacterium]
MKQQSKAYIFALSAVLLWSTVATAFKISLQQLTYSQLLLISSGTSLVVLFIIVILKIFLKRSTYSEQNKESVSPKNFNLNQIIAAIKRNLDYKGLIFSIALGFLNPFLYYLILFKAYSILPAQEAISLNYTWGIIVVLLSIILLKQKIHFINIIFLIISFVGVVIIATGGNFTDLHFKNPEGVIYALSSALVWGLFWILNMKDSRDDLIKLFLNFFFGFIFVVIYTVFFTSFKMQISVSFIAAVYVGIFEMGITFVFWLKALQLSKTTALVSNLAYLSPFLSLFFVSIIIKEEIQFSTIIGLIFIVIGIILQNLVKKNTFETNT